MKTTGVVRRIDDLGRIVIPKEIRKTLRIKDGESLEIFLESDNIVLKKYSHLENIRDFYKSYVDSIYAAIGENIMIVDRDNIVAVAGELKKKYLDKNISGEIDNVIQNRTTIIQSEFKEVSLTPDTNELVSYAMSPIIINGDAVGAVMILSKDRKLDEFEEKTVDIAAKFLGKYIEWLEIVCYNLYIKF